MHNLKEIRKDYQGFKKKLQGRNINIDIDNIKRLDERNRELIQKKKNLKKRKKKYLKKKRWKIISKI